MAITTQAITRAVERQYDGWIRLAAELLGLIDYESDAFLIPGLSFTSDKLKNFPLNTAIQAFEECHGFSPVVISRINDTEFNILRLDGGSTVFNILETMGISNQDITSKGDVVRELLKFIIESGEGLSSNSLSIYTRASRWYANNAECEPLIAPFMRSELKKVFGLGGVSDSHLIAVLAEDILHIFAESHITMLTYLPVAKLTSWNSAKVPEALTSISHFDFKCDEDHHDIITILGLPCAEYSTEVFVAELYSIVIHGREFFAEDEKRWNTTLRAIEAAFPDLNSSDPIDALEKDLGYVYSRDQLRAGLAAEIFPTIVNDRIYGVSFTYDGRVGCWRLWIDEIADVCPLLMGLNSIENPVEFVDFEGDEDRHDLFEILGIKQRFRKDLEIIDDVAALALSIEFDSAPIFSRAREVLPIIREFTPSSGEKSIPVPGSTPTTNELVEKEEKMSMISFDSLAEDMKANLIKAGQAAKLGGKIGVSKKTTEICLRTVKARMGENWPVFFQTPLGQRLEGPCAVAIVLAGTGIYGSLRKGHRDGKMSMQLFRMSLLTLTGMTSELTEVAIDVLKPFVFDINMSIQGDAETFEALGYAVDPEAD